MLRRDLFSQRSLPSRAPRALLVPYAFTFVDRLTVGFIISTVSLYFATPLGFEPVRIGLAMAAFLLGPLIGVGTLSLLRAAGWEPYPGAFVLVGALEALVVIAFLPWLLRLHRSSKTPGVQVDHGHGVITGAEASITGAAGNVPGTRAGE